MSRTDQSAEARGLWDGVHEWQEREGETDVTMLAVAIEAHAHETAAATLALVEQQRIANLIALSQAEDQSGMQSEHAMQAVWTHGPANPAWHERYNREPRPAPDIAAALGIESFEGGDR